MQPASSVGRRTARRWRLAGIAAAIVVAALSVVAVQRTAILAWVGSVLVVEDELQGADAIVPLSGGGLDREIEAAELFRSGYAPRVVLTLEPEGSAVSAYLLQRGIPVRTAEERRLELLAALGVPRNSVTVLREPVMSTFDEAGAVGAWALQAGARRLIIVTSPPHTARAKWVFERYAGEGKVALLVRASKLTEFRSDSWWTNRAMLREGIFELQKLAAYRLWY